MSAVIVRPTAAGLEAVLEALARGDLCVIPTDTVYGVAAIVASEPVRRLYRAKGRPETRPIPVLVSSTEAARDLAADWPPEAEALAQAFWPGALTIVVAAKAGLPQELTSGTGTVGIRWPDGILVQEIIVRAGGLLAVTSANRSGLPPATEAARAAAELGGEVAYVLDGGSLEGRLPSTVVSLMQGDVRIVREGGINPEAVRARVGALPQADSSSIGRNM